MNNSTLYNFWRADPREAASILLFSCESIVQKTLLTSKKITKSRLLSPEMPPKIVQSRVLLVLALLLQLVVGCGPSSAEDFREEGRRIASELTDELKQIKARNQLVASQESLTKKFDELVDVMIQARLCKVLASPISIDDALNIELQAQLLRVSRLEGGLEVLEKCQKSALHRLDRFEKEY